MAFRKIIVNSMRGSRAYEPTILFGPGPDFVYISFKGMGEDELPKYVTFLKDEEDPDLFMVEFSDKQTEGSLPGSTRNRKVTRKGFESALFEPNHGLTFPFEVRLQKKVTRGRARVLRYTFDIGSRVELGDS